MKPTIYFPAIFPLLTSQRLELLEYSLEDAPAFFELRSNLEFMRYLGSYPMEDIKESEERVRETIQSFQAKEGISWKICLKGSTDLIGYIGLWRIDFSHSRGEIGFGIHPKHQKKGLMLEAISAVIEYAFKQLNIRSIMADVDPDNTGSVMLLKKAGFQHEGRMRESFYFDGKFIDSDYYGIIQSDLEA